MSSTPPNDPDVLFDMGDSVKVQTAPLVPAGKHKTFRPYNPAQGFRASRHSCGRATRKVERSRLVRPGIFVVLKKLLERVRFRGMGEPPGKGGTAVRLLLLSGP